MLSLEVVTQAGLAPAISQSLDRVLLDLASGQPDHAWLRVYELAGDVLSLGRYHVAPATAVEDRVQLHRRLGGGRVLPLGAGFALVSLNLPHRSALVSKEPAALRAEQALNRCVRGLLGGLRGLGIDAFYPGRDCVTIGGRTVGLVSLESDANGSTVFEAALAIDGDWQRLADLVTAVDPDGVIAARTFPPGETTTLSAHGVVPTLSAFADAVAASYAQQFGLILSIAAEPSTPLDAAERALAWVLSRQRRAGLDRHAVEWSQLGAFEVYLSARTGAIDDVLFAGDFVASSPSIAQLEQRLRGCRLERSPIAAVVDAVYADPRHFLLGVGPLSTVVETILRAR
jgi:hypothetical protein